MCSLAGIDVTLIGYVLSAVSRRGQYLFLIGGSLFTASEHVERSCSYWLTADRLLDRRHRPGRIVTRRMDPEIEGGVFVDFFNPWQSFGSVGNIKLY